MPHCSSSLSHRCSIFFLNFHFLSCISYLCAKCQSPFFLVSSLCSLSGIFFFPLYDIIPPILLLDASPIAPLSHFPFLLYLRFFYPKNIIFIPHFLSYPLILFLLSSSTYTHSLMAPLFYCFTFSLSPLSSQNIRLILHFLSYLLNLLHPLVLTSLYLSSPLITPYLSSIYIIPDFPSRLFILQHNNAYVNSLCSSCITVVLLCIDKGVSEGLYS